MLNKGITRFAVFLIVSLTLLTPTADAAADTKDTVLKQTAETIGAVTAQVEPAADITSAEYTPEVTLALLTEGVKHAAFIHGCSNGSFAPTRSVTLAEAAQMLYGLLAQTPAARVSFDDVASDAWYYDAVGLLAAGGIFDYTGNMAYPQKTLSRAEFVSMLSRFFPEEDRDCSYSDVPANTRYYSDISKATWLGWVSGFGDGTFRPDNPISRAEAVTVISRALGHTPDHEKIDSIVPVYTDVSQNYWAYYDIMEASVPHTILSNENSAETWDTVDTASLHRPTGPMTVGLELYYIDNTGAPVKGQYVGGLYFGEDGRYTSGDAEIDAYVKNVLSQITSDSMNREAKLKAAYIYTRDSFKYLRRNYYSIGATGWALNEARTMFSTGMGNCYCYTAVFYCLARQLGYDAAAISGVVGTSASPHGWVEIGIDTVIYIFDPELEMAYRKKNRIYDFFMMSYDLVPWPYVKS